jgi:hypothetical protein
MLVIDPTIDRLIIEFYNGTIGPYWDSARRLVEDEYRSIEFPFEQIASPSFSIEVQWTLDQLEGYLLSWSATQKFIRENGYDPLRPLIDNIKKSWPTGKKTGSFPLFTKIGKLAAM